MEKALRSLGYVTVGAAAVAGIVYSEEAQAQPSLDRVLSEAHVTEGDRCSVVRVDFNFPVRYVSHFPTDNGNELQIRVRAIERQMDGEMALKRESLRLPSTDLTPIREIDFEGSRPEGPTIQVVFSKKTFFRVGQGADFRSLVIVLSGENASVDCTPVTPLSAMTPGDLITTPPPTPGAPATPTARTDRLELPPATAQTGAGADAVESQVLLDTARTALLDRNFPQAIQLLTKLLQRPEGPLAAEAHELLGIARERNGQLAHAKGEYEDYLRLYPQGAGADRVRQRLSGLLTDATPRPELRSAQRAKEADETEWKLNTSLSQYYMRDDTSRTTDDPVLGKITDDTINQHEILTAVDATLGVRNSDFQAKMRVATTYTNDFREDGQNESSISAAYLEASDAKQRVLGRVGRQTRSTGGIFGRFDGGLLSMRATNKFKLNLAAGYPVESSKDQTFNNNRYFYAASVDIGRIGKWDGDLYYLRQSAYRLVDREAVGAEVRYVGDKASAFGLVDYDVHYKQVNIGLVNANVTLADETTFSVSADYRRAPLLTTTNALQGQIAGSLDELKASYSPEQIEQLANDRTAYSRTATVSASHPFNERVAVNVDATVSNMSSTKESGGVPANPASGNEYYYSAQVVGSSLFTDGDLVIGGLRYADTATSNRYTVDLSARYPVSRDFRVSPRVRVSYRENKNDDGTQTAVRPSVRLNYNVHRNFQLEFEGGGEWQQDEFSGMSTESRGFFLNLGYRLDF